MHLLAPGLINQDTLEALYLRILLEYKEPGDALRVVRNLSLERIAYLDCEAHVPLVNIMQMMTTLAEWALTKAYRVCYAALCAKYGTPCDSEGYETIFWILGMGKLGADELNVSSDIDLVYVYDRVGNTLAVPRERTPQAAEDVLPLHSKSVEAQSTEHSLTQKTDGQISNQDFYTKLVHALQIMLDSVTQHGRVFRVDLALRPFGLSGPSAVCLDALEEYLHSHGREWERFAWLKCRVVAPFAQDSLPSALSKITMPFVYRKYLDYAVFDALRDLHQKIRSQALRTAHGRPERLNDIKIGPGGIREIEFTVQLLQVVRGGQFPELRVRSTLEALSALEQARLISPDSSEQLQSAYAYLRRLEHRIQYLDDQQTHILPTDALDLQWLAMSMGHSSTAEMLSQLNAHRAFVSKEFAALLGNPAPPPAVKPSVNLDALSSDLSNSLGSSDTSLDLSDALDRLDTAQSQALGSRIKELLSHPRALQLKSGSRSKLYLLIQQVIVWVGEQSTTHTAVLRWCDWMEALLRRESYLSLLLERPTTLRNLLYLLGASRWAARYLTQYPGVIDDLADLTTLNQRFDSSRFTAALLARISAQECIDPTDDEALLNLMRRAHHSELFLCLFRDLSGKLTIQEVADDLSALADAIIHITSQLVWRRLPNKHSNTPSFGIIGYGKLGGKELSYGSDLDIVFIYDDAHPQASEIYSGFARKIIQWLSVKTVAGDLYEIDTALRPNGSSGLLVSEFDAFENYQKQKGTNVAWLWEHQAMTRARMIYGNEAHRSRFNSIRNHVLTAPRNLDQLRTEIVKMRDKLLRARAVNSDIFDLKYSAGAMVDVEFSVQYLVLAFSAQHGSLTQNIGNIALLDLAQSLGLISTANATKTIQAYTLFRREQHLARLDERKAQFDVVKFAKFRDDVLNLWNDLMQVQ